MRSSAGFFFAAYGLLDLAAASTRSPRGDGSRRLLAASRAALVRRDDACPNDAHSCLDVGHSEACCTNDTYCYINTTGLAKCCPLGSNCIEDSYCPSTAYYVSTTTTTTTTTKTASTATATAIPTVVTEAGCRSRQCPQTGYFLCSPSLGGNCCPYGAACQVGGNCLVARAVSTTILPLTTTPISTAPAAAVESSSNSTSIGPTGPPGSELTNAARAGIVIGSIAGVFLVIVLFACIGVAKLRRSQRTAQKNTIYEDHRRRAAMTAVSASSQAWPGHHHQQQQQQRRSQDYFGPTPVLVGGTTESDSNSPATTPVIGVFSERDAIPPPLNMPRRPADAAVPAEMSPGLQAITTSTIGDEGGGGGERRGGSRAPVSGYSPLASSPHALSPTGERFDLHGGEHPDADAFSPPSPLMPRTRRGQ